MIMLVSSDNGNVICSSLEEYRAELRRCTDIQKSYEIDIAFKAGNEMCRRIFYGGFITCLYRMGRIVVD